MTIACRIACTLVSGVASLAVAAVQAQADTRENVRAKNAAGFSEIAVPQITGTIPLKRLRDAAQQKPANKPTANDVPNQPISCGPENAQSIACQSKTR